MDGIVALPNGALLVASQDGHNVYHVPASGKPTVVASDITSRPPSASTPSATA